MSHIHGGEPILIEGWHPQRLIITQYNLTGLLFIDRGTILPTTAPWNQK